jgi:hypothetical protein
MRRRCGWVPAALDTPARVVWVRGQVSTDVCPTSFITAQSIGWIEEFLARKWLRLGLPAELNMRQAEAFLILEQHFALENIGGPR